MDGADDGETVLRLVVADRVAACEDRARAADDLVGAREDLAQHLRRQLLRKCGDREREQRRPAHREDVVECVRRRDRAEVAGVVHDRREEVDREDERALVVEAIDGGVVRRIEPHEQVGCVDRDEAGEQLLEPRRRVLRGTPTRPRERGERRGACHVTHSTFVEESSGRRRTMVAESHTPSPLSPLIHAKVAIPLAAFVV